MSKRECWPTYVHTKSNVIVKFRMSKYLPGEKNCSYWLLKTNISVLTGLQSALDIFVSLGITLLSIKKSTILIKLLRLIMMEIWWNVKFLVGLLHTFWSLFAPVWSKTRRNSYLPQTFFPVVLPGCPLIWLPRKYYTPVERLPLKMSSNKSFSELFQNDRGLIN